MLDSALNIIRTMEPRIELISTDYQFKWPYAVYLSSMKRDNIFYLSDSPEIYALMLGEWDLVQNLQDVGKFYDSNFLEECDVYI